MNPMDHEVAPSEAPSCFAARLALIAQLQSWLAIAALIVMMAVTVADVFLRYLFNSPIRGSYELVEALLLVFVFHGMAAAFLTRKNIVIDIIDSFVPERVTRGLIRFSDVVSILALALIGWAMMRTALQAFEYGDRKLELGLPVYVLWMAALAGLAGTMLCAMGALLTRAVVSREQPAA